MRSETRLGSRWRRRTASAWRWAVATLALAAGTTQAQTARLTILTDSVTTGEPFEVSVAVTHGPGQQITFPAVPPGAAEARPALSFGDADAVSLHRFPPVVRDTARVDSAVYRVVTFAADTARVGPISVSVAAGSEAYAVQTGSSVVSVRSVLVGESPPYEPAPLGPVETFPSATPIWVALGTLAALVTALAAWGAVRLFRPSASTPAPAPYPTALAQLGALDQEAPTAPDAIEAHVVALRGVVRDYLSDRLGLPAREATTPELAALLDADDRVDEDAAHAVRRALRPTDLVAFARVRPATEVVARLRAEARSAVEAVEAGLRARDAASADDSETAAPLSA